MQSAPTLPVAHPSYALEGTRCTGRACNTGENDFFGQNDKVFHRSGRAAVAPGYYSPVRPTYPSIILIILTSQAASGAQSAPSLYSC